MVQEEIKLSIDNYKDQIRIIKDNDEYKKIRHKISFTWKDESHKMLESAVKAYKKESITTEEKDDAKKAFTLAVTTMIGGYGSVARTLSTKDSFMELVLNNYENIKKGKIGLNDNDNDKFNIFNLKDTLNLSKEPLSYITKICHIINPNGCPIIWDKNIRDALDIKNKDTYKKYLKKIRNFVKEYDRTDIYNIDSAIWAGRYEKLNELKENLASKSSSNPQPDLRTPFPA